MQGPQRPVDVAASCREGPDGNEALAHLLRYFGTLLSGTIVSADRYIFPSLPTQVPGYHQKYHDAQS